MEGQAKLFQVIRAAHPACGFPGGLDCRQQKADEDPDDGDDDEQFDQGKAVFEGGLVRFWREGTRGTGADSTHGFT